MPRQRQQQQQQLQQQPRPPTMTPSAPLTISKNSKKVRGRSTKNGEAVKRRRTVPFLQGLLAIVTDTIALNDVVTFFDGNVVIKDVERLEQEVLSKYVKKGCTFSSFQRNLHYFGFRKISKKPLVFFNHNLKGEHHREILTLTRRINISETQSHSKIRIWQQPLSTFFSSVPPQRSSPTGNADKPSESRLHDTKAGASQKPPAPPDLQPYFPDETSGKIKPEPILGTRPQPNKAPSLIKQTSIDYGGNGSGYGASAGRVDMVRSFVHDHQSTDQVHPDEDKSRGKAGNDRDSGSHSRGDPSAPPPSLVCNKSESNRESGDRPRRTSYAKVFRMQSISAVCSNDGNRIVRRSDAGMRSSIGRRRDAEGADDKPRFPRNGISGWQLPDPIRDNDRRDHSSVVQPRTAARKYMLHRLVKEGHDDGKKSDLYSKPSSDPGGAPHGTEKRADGSDDIFMNSSFRNLLTAVEIGTSSTPNKSPRADRNDTAHPSGSNEKGRVSAANAFKSVVGERRCVNSRFVSSSGSNSDSTYSSDGRSPRCSYSELCCSPRSPPLMCHTPSASRDSCAKSISPKVSFYMAAPTLSPMFKKAIRSPSLHVCQSQRSSPHGTATPIISPLRRRNFHEDDMEFVVKEFGDSLLSDSRTFEGGLPVKGSHGGNTVRNDEHSDSGTRNKKRAGAAHAAVMEGGGHRTGRKRSRIVPVHSPRKASVETRGDTSSVRSPSLFPPTPASLSLRSPVNQTFPYLLGL